MALKRLYEPQRESESLYMTMIRNMHFIGIKTKPPCLAFGTTINETWWAEGC